MTAHPPAGSARGSHVDELLRLCQSRALQPDYTVHELSSGDFSITLRLGRITLTDDGPFESRQAAKESVAKLAITLTETAPSQNNAVVGISNNNSDSVTAGAANSRNWRGELQGKFGSDACLEYIVYCLLVNAFRPGITEYYQHRVGMQLPVYEEYNARGNTAFACEVTVAHRPNEPFGGQENYFPVKKMAYQNAAREALQWLQSTR